MNGQTIDSLRKYFRQSDDIEFAALVGSQVTGLATENSDWDIAVQCAKKDEDYLQHLGRLENIRREIAKLLKLNSAKIDIIDVPQAKLAMRELIANHGVPICGEQSLSWYHFLQRTWRDLEDYHWEELYVS